MENVPHDLAKVQATSSGIDLRHNDFRPSIPADTDVQIFGEVVQRGSFRLYHGTQRWRGTKIPPTTQLFTNIYPETPSDSREI